MKSMMRMAGVAVLMVFAISAAAWAEEATSKAQTTCPIMEGNKVNKSLFVDHDGKRVYVCCKGCIAEVKKDAAKYVKQLEGQGIVLDKAPVEKTDAKTDAK